MTNFLLAGKGLMTPIMELTLLTMSIGEHSMRTPCLSLRLQIKVQVCSNSDWTQASETEIHANSLIFHWNAQLNRHSVRIVKEFYLFFLGHQVTTLTTKMVSSDSNLILISYLIAYDKFKNRNFLRSLFKTDLNFGVSFIFICSWYNHWQNRAMKGKMDI